MKQHQNIKNQISKIKHVVQRSKIFEFLFVILIFTFLFLNLISSQYISPIFFKFVNNDKVSTISFLQKIKTLPEYQNILTMNDDIYGKSIKTQISIEENKKKVIINNLKEQLKINSKARDVLYSLYQLTKDEGYLRQAQEVDPTINTTNTTNPTNLPAGRQVLQINNQINK